MPQVSVGLSHPVLFSLMMSGFINQHRVIDVKLIMV
ncbi:MAG: hypothetical protein ACJASB_002097 [Shewanella psychromarinicola]|jgi:hypothetical protein